MKTLGKQRRRLLVFICILAALALGGAFASSRFRRATTKEQTQYKVATAGRGDVRKTVSASGTLQAWSTVDIKSKAGGRVDRLLVEVGDRVRKDQILARIDPTDSLLSVQQSQADVDSAKAKISQNGTQYGLQVQQSEIAIDTARAQLADAVASRDAAGARLATAQTQSSAQPIQTRAAIRQAQANYESALKQRQQLDSTQAQEKAQAQAAYDQAQADLENAEANLTRQKGLAAKGYVSLQSADQQRANTTSARAQVTSAQKKLTTIDPAQQAERASSEAKVAQALAQLQSAQAQTDIASRRNSAAESQAALSQAAAKVEQARAALRQAVANRANNAIRQQDIVSARATEARARAAYVNAKVTLDQTIVRSPSEGVVLQKYVAQGTIITSGLSLNSTGTSIVQLGDISKMYVDVSVDETDIAGVDEGQPVTISVDAYPGVSFDGTVARVNPQAAVESNVTTVHVRVEVDNSAPTFRLLKPGMNATCDFVEDSKTDVIAVPTEAVKQNDSGGSYVEIASGGKPSPADTESLVGVTVKQMPVEIGLQGNDSVEITSGLTGGETIVVQTTEPEEAAPPASGGALGSGGPPGMGGGGRR